MAGEFKLGQFVRSQDFLSDTDDEPSLTIFEDDSPLVGGRSGDGALNVDGSDSGFAAKSAIEYHCAVPF